MAINTLYPEGSKDENGDIERGSLTPEQIQSKKSLAAMISLGTLIMDKMVGDTIKGTQEQARQEDLMTAAIVSRLKL